MILYDIFFFGAVFFLCGVLLGSLQWGFSIIIFVLAAEFVLCVAFIFRARISWLHEKLPLRRYVWFSVLLIFVFGGALYYTADNLRFHETRPQFGKKIYFSGIVVRDPLEKLNLQELVVSLDEPRGANVLVRTGKYPEFHYGDGVQGEGALESPTGSYAGYLEKERVHGIFSFPKIQRVSEHNASFIKESLFVIKHRVLDAIRTVLPQEDAAFLSGLMVGERSEFSKAFISDMQKSGTTHLVALSGYNITIIVWAVMTLCLYFLPRRWAFLITLMVIIGFVCMTGAEASVVRAAVMGVLILVAYELGKTYDVRNAVVLTALIMVLQNPKVLVFDAGFELSFLALVGIVYVKPIITKLFRLEGNGFLSWKENLTTTLSAQLLVLPVLIQQFGAVSPISLLTNIIILEFIPLTMALGFMLAVAVQISYYFALPFSWLLAVLLRFETGIIKFFGGLEISWSSTMSPVAFICYYLVIILILWYGKRFISKTHRA